MKSLWHPGYESGSLKNFYSFLIAVEVLFTNSESK